MLRAMRPSSAAASVPALWLAAALGLAAPAAAQHAGAGGHLQLYVQPVEALFLADAAARAARLRERLAAAEAAGDERTAAFLRGLLAQSGEAPPPPPAALPPAGD